MSLNKTLTKLFSWPIPYWLTPIGILLLVGYWHGFSWKISTENWPFWLWLIDKGITVGSIIGAAYFAQSIFNINAKKREDRDRRLNSLILIKKQYLRFYNSIATFSGDHLDLENTHKELLKIWTEIISEITMFDFNINDESKQIFEITSIIETILTQVRKGNIKGFINTILDYENLDKELSGLNIKFNEAILKEFKRYEGTL